MRRVFGLCVCAHRYVSPVWGVFVFYTGMGVQRQCVGGLCDVDVQCVWVVQMGGVFVLHLCVCVMRAWVALCQCVVCVSQYCAIHHPGSIRETCRDEFCVTPHLRQRIPWGPQEMPPYGLPFRCSMQSRGLALAVAIADAAEGVKTCPGHCVLL